METMSAHDARVIKSKLCKQWGPCIRNNFCEKSYCQKYRKKALSKQVLKVPVPVFIHLMKFLQKSKVSNFWFLAFTLQFKVPCIKLEG